MSGKSQQTLIGGIHPDVLAFTVGQDPVLDLELADWDCLGTAAHVTALARLRMQPPVMRAADARRVIRALIDILAEIREGRFTISAADQDVHLAVERLLTARLGDLGRRVHTGRSRNDQVALDLRLHMREHLCGLQTEVADLADGLLRFARRHARVPMVGRTHLQPAMPSSVGLWSSGHAEALLDDLLPVDAAYAYADRCPLGSAAGYGVPLPLDRALTARLLGFAAPHANVFYASNARGKCEAIVLGALGQVMLTLARLSEDLILFSMPEFGYFVLPPELCTGSSIMPQKYNPDALELIRAKTAAVLGQGFAACGIVKALPGGYNRDLQETKALYLDGIRTTRASLRIMKLLVDALAVRPERLRAAFSPGVFATDRALQLVAEGMPFRDAYRHVRSHLEELTSSDPDAAWAAKDAGRGSAGCEISLLRQRAHDARRVAQTRRRAAHRVFSRLLGVPFPVGRRAAGMLLAASACWCGSAQAQVTTPAVWIAPSNTATACAATSGAFAQAASAATPWLGSVLLLVAAAGAWTVLATLLAGRRAMPRGLAETLVTHALAGELSEARQACEDRPGMLATVALTVFDQIRHTPRANVSLVRSVVDAELRRQSDLLRARAGWLRDLAVLAFLLALLGAGLGAWRGVQAAAAGKPAWSGAGAALQAGCAGIALTAVLALAYAGLRRLVARQVAALEVSANRVMVAVAARFDK